jgi:DNA-binding MarR family transcriptional regulator
MSIPAEAANGSEATLLTEIVTRLRRALRTSIRVDYPWESLPMAQVELLLTVREHQPARIGQLASLLRLAPNTVSGLVQALVTSGYATRTPDPSDRRVAVVTLTEAGQARLAEWEQAHRERLRNALQRLSPTDQTAVRAALPALARLVEHLTALAADPGGATQPERLA